MGLAFAYAAGLGFNTLPINLSRSLIIRSLRETHGHNIKIQD